MFWWCCVLCRFLISSKVTKYGIFFNSPKCEYKRFPKTELRRTSGITELFDLGNNFPEQGLTPELPLMRVLSLSPASEQRQHKQ
ncbi:unnamed protein product [Sphagnum jensenii]|uniref:Secreted protein n=1 Tax=Sphagnum jensenii TaxID=128206 RepID=A0ABP0X043_9BRYO